MPRSSSRNYKTIKPIEYTPTKENRPGTNQVQTQSQQPGFLSNVVQGFAWGTGTVLC